MKDRTSFKAVLLIVGAMLLAVSFSMKKRAGRALIALGMCCLGASALV